MKNLIYVFLFGITACISNSKVSGLESVRQIPKDYVELNDSVFVSSIEVLNINYLEFLYNIKKDSSSSYYNSMLLDSTITENGLNPNIIYEDDPTHHYFRYPGFRYFPLIAVSKNQIEEFCKWKTDLYNRKMNLRNIVSINYTFRLPTLEECKSYDVSHINFDCNTYYNLSERPAKERYNKSMTSYQIGYKESVKKLDIKRPLKQQYYTLSIGLKDKKIIQVKEKCYFHPKDASRYNMPEYSISEPKNRQGLHGIIGNVSEMTQNDTIAFGGNYLDSLDYALKYRRRIYSEPSTWLGARLVCEVTKQ